MFPTDPVEVLRINDAHRRPDVTGDLWTADEIAALPPAAYLYQVPTFAPASWPAARRVTQAQYNADFARRHPIAMAVLDTLAAKRQSRVRKGLPPGVLVVVAGGAAAAPYYDHNVKASDVDFFITAPDATDAADDVEPGLWEAADGIIVAFRKVLRVLEDFDGLALVQILAPGVLTLEAFYRDKNYNMQTMKFQVILRVYASPSAVVHAFDVPSCCTVFDGTTAHSTTLGAFAHRFRVNLVHPAYRSTTYEARLLKYFERRYALGLVDLKAGVLTAGATTRLPHLVLNTLVARGNRATGSVSLPAPQPDSDYGGNLHNPSLRPRRGEWSGYNSFAADFVNLAHLAAGTERYVIIRVANLRLLARERDDGDLDYDEEWIPLRTYADDPPDFGAVFDPDMFEAALERVVDGAISRTNQIRITGLAKYLGLTPAEVVNFVQAAITAITSNPGARVSAVDALAPFRARIRARYDAAALRPIEWWIKQDPGRQYTSSLNPRMEDPAAWYGPDRVAATPGETSPETYLQSLEGALASQSIPDVAGALFDTTCSLCLTAVTPGGLNTLTLPCGHLFHATTFEESGCEGLFRWLTNGGDDCPNCRHVFGEPLPADSAPAVPPIALTVDWGHVGAAGPLLAEDDNPVCVEPNDHAPSEGPDVFRRIAVHRVGATPSTELDAHHRAGTAKRNEEAPPDSDEMPALSE